MRRPGQATGGGGGVPRPHGAWERPGQGPDGCSAGCARTAGAQGPGWDQRGALFANPPAPRARPSLSPWSRLLRGPRLLTCRVAAAPPLLLHLAAQTPAPPTAREDAGRPGCRAGGTIAIAAAAASAHPRSRRSWGRRGAVTELRRAPPPPPTPRPGTPPALAPSPPRWPPCALGTAAPRPRAPLCRQRTTGRGAGGLGRNEKSGGANSTRRPKGSWSQRDAPWHGRVGFLPALRPPAFPALEPARLSGLQLNTFSPKLALSNFVL